VSVAFSFSLVCFVVVCVMNAWLIVCSLDIVLCCGCLCFVCITVLIAIYQKKKHVQTPSLAHSSCSLGSTTSKLACVPDTNDTVLVDPNYLRELTESVEDSSQTSSKTQVTEFCFSELTAKVVARNKNQLNSSTEKEESSFELSVKVPMSCCELWKRQFLLVILHRFSLIWFICFQ
jgi:hypothetical protein